MQSRGTRSELTPRILAEISDLDFAQIDFPEGHRSPFPSWLSEFVHIVDEDRHPLISRAVGVDCTAALSRCFDFHALAASLRGIVWISAFHDQVRMTIEVPVLS